MHHPAKLHQHLGVLTSAKLPKESGRWIALPEENVEQVVQVMDHSGCGIQLQHTSVKQAPKSLGQS